MCSSPRETLLPEIRQKNQKMIIWLCQKILIKIWSKRGPPPPPPKKKKKKNWILCQNSRTRELKIRVVGFVLKKLLKYFEMLIVPHALQCVDGCFGPVFTASTFIWQRPYCEGILLSYGRILPRLRCSCYLVYCAWLLWATVSLCLPYFFGYKTEFFSFQNNPKNLDPSYKTDLHFWECLGRVKLVLLQNYIGLI